MSVYTALLIGTEATQEARELTGELARWHDAMVLHQRHVRRAGTAAACSADCPHAVARRLWKEARRLFGPVAGRLAFLRACAESPRHAAAGARPQADAEVPAASPLLRP